MSALTQTDLANIAILLQRLRTGEKTLGTAGNMGIAEIDAPVAAMFQRVEAFLSEGIRRMDTPISDGGPAFPCEWDYVNSNRSAANGMTLRDYFATEALPLSAAAYENGHQDGKEGICRDAYRWADAMLKARQA